MPSLRDAIKDDIVKAKGGVVHTSSDAAMIEQKLNKLFYAPQNPKEELRMIKMQYQQKQGDRYGLHASAIIVSDNEFCVREQVLSLFFRQAQGENIMVGLKRIFEEGTFIGEKWQRLFIRGGLGGPEDMDISQFNEEYDLSFTPDAIITIGKVKYVVETKSMNTFQFKKATSHPSGRKQLRLYMHLTGIHQGFVLVEDKNDQNFKVFLETYNYDDVAPYIERLEQVQYYKRKLLKKKVMVEGICDSSTCKRATKCNMRDACFNIGQGRVKLSARV